MSEIVLPTTKCKKCGEQKSNCLFTPGELKRPYPRCRDCCKKAHERVHHTASYFDNLRAKEKALV
jgi:hypothetical protein